MTTAAISFNPLPTTNAAGSFSTVSDGLYQGTALDSPNSRYNLSGGLLATTETLPMWGGVGIFEDIPASPGNSVLGGTVGRATALTSLTGFSVFDQAYNGLTTPQSPVPLYGSGMTVNFYRFGSGQRIALQMDPSLVSLDGGLITQQVSWDFSAQKLVPYAPAYTAGTLTGFSWASTGGGRVTFTGVSQDYTSALSAGSVIDISGIVVTGSPTQSINGNWTVVSVTSNTIVVAAPAAANPFGTYSSGGAIAGGGGALPVKILQVQPTNCKTVAYDPTTGFATWNTNGACAIVLI